MSTAPVVTHQPLRAPFPWAGGKRRVAHLVWDRFGDTLNYVEPFFGSGAVLLGRPFPVRTETVNDLDGYLVNLWRALAADPDAVAHYADWPVSELDLHARHRWLLAQADFRERMRADPDYYDAKIAGWWVWGCCMWIGSGWCAERWYNGDEPPEKVPYIEQGGRGALRSKYANDKRPWLGRGGRGVHRTEGGPAQQVPYLDAGGRGVPATTLAGRRQGAEPWQPRPIVGREGIGVHSVPDLVAYFHDLADRLRRVRVCCGDWTRILGPTPTWHQGMTAVFLDPPYGHAQRQPDLYATDRDVAPAVAEWARANGDNPRMRIALCGLVDEHQMPADWEMVRWNSTGGYGNQGQGRGRENADRECLWFSPACQRPAARERQLGLALEEVAGG